MERGAGVLTRAGTEKCSRAKEMQHGSLPVSSAALASSRLLSGDVGNTFYPVETFYPVSVQSPPLQKREGPRVLTLFLPNEGPAHKATSLPFVQFLPFVLPDLRCLDLARGVYAKTDRAKLRGDFSDCHLFQSCDSRLRLWKSQTVST